MKLIVHYPKDQEGWDELSRRVASVHADVVSQKIKNLPIPKEQKLKLFDAVIADAKGC